MRYRLVWLIVVLFVAGTAAANQAPTLIHDGDYRTDEGQLLTFSVNGNDPDGDALTFSATNLPRGATFEGRTFRWTPDMDQDGTYRVRFTVTDSHGAHDTDTITITVRAVNSFPVIESAYPYEGRTVEFEEGTSRRFTVKATDPDGDTLRYRWALDGRRVSSSTSFLYEPDYEDAGQRLLEVTVSDGDLEKHVLWNVIIADKNRAPRFTRNVIDYRIEEGKTLRFTANAEDPDDDLITFSSTSLPQGAGLDGATGTFTWTPDLRQRGYYEVVIKASDTKSGLAWRSFFITVGNSSALERLDRAQRQTNQNTGSTTTTDTSFLRGVESSGGVSHERSAISQTSPPPYVVPDVPERTVSYDIEQRTVGTIIDNEPDGETNEPLQEPSQPVVPALIAVAAIVAVTLILKQRRNSGRE